jgi:hypothetical protein
MDQLTAQVKGFQEVQTQLKGQTDTKDQKEAYMKKSLILICMLLMVYRVYYNTRPNSQRRNRECDGVWMIT